LHARLHLSWGSAHRRRRHSGRRGDQSSRSVSSSLKIRSLLLRSTTVATAAVAECEVASQTSAASGGQLHRFDSVQTRECESSDRGDRPMPQVVALDVLLPEVPRGGYRLFRSISHRSKAGM